MALYHATGELRYKVWGEAYCECCEQLIDSFVRNKLVEVDRIIAAGNSDRARAIVVAELESELNIDLHLALGLNEWIQPLEIVELPPDQVLRLSNVPTLW